MDYYKVSNNRRFDAAALAAADEAVARQGDGRISKSDAADVHAKLYDGGKLTDTEKATVRKIRRDYTFTGAGADEFERLNRSAGQKLANRAPKADAKPGQGLRGMLALRAQQQC